MVSSMKISIFDIFNLSIITYIHVSDSIVVSLLSKEE